jgi:hypothetical protein
MLVTGVSCAPLREARILAYAYPRAYAVDSLESPVITITQSFGYVPPLKELLTSAVAAAVLAAVKTKRSHNGEEDDRARASHGTYVATIQGTSIKVSEYVFSSQIYRHTTMCAHAVVYFRNNIEAMITFYDDRRALRKVGVDREWLNDATIWEESERQDVPFLDEYARECTMNMSHGTSVVALMQQAILAQQDAYSLSTIVESSPGSAIGYKHEGPRRSIELLDVAQRLGRVFGDGNAGLAIPWHCRR